MPEEVDDDGNKEDQDACDHQKERRTDEEGGDAAAFRGGRGDPKGHDEGFGDGFEELHGVPLLIVGGTQSSRDLDGTKVTLRMGGTDGAKLGVSCAVQATETIAERNETKVPGLG